MSSFGLAWSGAFLQEGYCPAARWMRPSSTSRETVTEPHPLSDPCPIKLRSRDAPYSLHGLSTMMQDVGVTVTVKGVHCIAGCVLWLASTYLGFSNGMQFD
ncbi:hypothetical protein BJY00DRAFT_226198 [Aspergillus carlsbadensis]|nr:hypothetical protein BJY00DRAFT_226198 [Aspergillus carlsbadensis]